MSHRSRCERTSARDETRQTAKEREEAIGRMRE
jgi:hypothetical protein